MPSIVNTPNKNPSAGPRSKAEKQAENDRWLEIYRAMRRQRALDEKMVNLQRQGRIGFYGPITGQEAATIGSVAALEKQDWVVPALREAGAALYRGFPLNQYVYQLMGNSLDWTQGRQMPCHQTYRDGNFVAMSSCVGNQMPQAVGIAMGMQYREENGVVLSYLGDGATSEGDFHNALTFAGVYKSPIVFFCQNNHWAISVPASKQSASKNFAVKAQAYGFSGVQVDGNDAVEVYKTTRNAVEKARNGDGPTLIEALTYRIGGHTTSDDASRYRDPKEVEMWQKRDPIEKMQKFLQKNHLWDAKKEEEAEAEFLAKISQIIEDGEKAAPPSIESLFTDVYAEVPSHLQEQLRDAKTYQKES